MTNLYHFDWLFKKYEYEISIQIYIQGKLHINWHWKTLVIIYQAEVPGCAIWHQKTTSIQHRAYSWTDRHAQLSVKPMSVNILYKIHTNSNDTCTNK